MNLRPIDLARAVGISAQQVRRYEALGLIPAATRTAAGHRAYTDSHLEALITARAILAGFGWERGFWAIHHLAARRHERAFAIADRAHMDLYQARRRALAVIRMLGDGLPSPAPSGSTPMTIHRAASAVGVTTSALRHWEREGLVEASRGSNGYRRYSQRQLQRLQLVALLRAGGYSIAEIHDVLDGMASQDPAAAVAAARRRLEEINESSVRCASATAALMRRFEESQRVRDGGDGVRGG